MQSKVHPTYKTKYRVANWSAYNQALVRRGDVTLWLAPDAIAAWTPRRSGMRGGQRRYSDLAIETALTLRLIYHLPLPCWLLASSTCDNRFLAEDYHRLLTVP